MNDFGPWLTFREAVKSATALRKGIANNPTLADYRRMKAIYEAIYVPVCRQFGKIPVTSFYRSVNLNRAIGGAKNSQHLTGEAIDIDADGLAGVTNGQLFKWIRQTLLFDQLILEHPDKDGNPAWVHVSFKEKGPNRKQILTVKRP